MSQRFLGPIVAIATVVLVVLLAQMPVAGQQAPSLAPTKSAAPRTSWGDPDLQGVYTFSTNTPLERPKFLGKKNTFTQEELAEIEAKANEEYNQEDGPSRIFLPFAGALEPATPNSNAQVGAASAPDVGTYNNFWTATEKGRLLDRTSLIVDPEDGRLPSLTPRRKS